MAILAAQQPILSFPFLQPDTVLSEGLVTSAVTAPESAITAHAPEVLPALPATQPLRRPVLSSSVLRRTLRPLMLSATAAFPTLLRAAELTQPPWASTHSTALVEATTWFDYYLLPYAAVAAATTGILLTLGGLVFCYQGGSWVVSQFPIERQGTPMKLPEHKPQRTLIALSAEQKKQLEALALNTRDAPFGRIFGIEMLRLQNFDRSQMENRRALLNPFMDMNTAHALINSILSFSNSLHFYDKHLCGFAIKDNEETVFYYEPQRAFLQSPLCPASYVERDQKYPFAINEIVPAYQVTRLPHDSGIKTTWNGRPNPVIVEAQKFQYIKGFFLGEQVLVKTHFWYDQIGTIVGFNDDGTVHIALQNGNHVPRLDPLNILTRRHITDWRKFHWPRLSNDPTAIAYVRASYLASRPGLLPRADYSAWFGFSPIQANVPNCALVAAMLSARLLGFFELLVRSSFKKGRLGIHSVTLPLGSGNKGTAHTLYPWEYALPHRNPNFGQPDQRRQQDIDRREFLWPVRGSSGFQMLEIAINKALNGTAHRGNIQQGLYIIQVLHLLFGDAIKPVWYDIRPLSEELGQGLDFLRYFNQSMQVGIAATRAPLPNETAAFIFVTDIHGKTRRLSFNHGLTIVKVEPSRNIVESEPVITLLDPQNSQDPLELPLDQFRSAVTSVGGGTINLEEIFSGFDSDEILPAALV